MPLDVLSSIKGATSSEAVNQLFEVIKNANIDNQEDTLSLNTTVVNLDDLREDEVVESEEVEKNIIKENFPAQKNGFLVVSKVIE